MCDALLQYDDTPEGEAAALAQLRRGGQDARASKESPYTLAIMIRALFWDDPDIMSWGQVSLHDSSAVKLPWLHRHRHCVRVPLGDRRATIRYFKPDNGPLRAYQFARGESRDITEPDLSRQLQSAGIVAMIDPSFNPQANTRAR